MRNIIKLTVVSVVVVVGFSAVMVKLRHSSNSASQKGADRLVVHEWGTFTSIAGKDGVSLEWRPLNGASDLPKFVHSIQQIHQGLRHADTKATLEAYVRMETPVIYFYPTREMDV